MSKINPTWYLIIGLSISAIIIILGILLPPYVIKEKTTLYDVILTQRQTTLALIGVLFALISVILLSTNHVINVIISVIGVMIKDLKESMKEGFKDLKEDIKESIKEARETILNKLK